MVTYMLTGIHINPFVGTPLVSATVQATDDVTGASGGLGRAVQDLTIDGNAIGLQAAVKAFLEVTYGITVNLPTP